jgi:DNA-binding response OmpR family regulator
MGSASSVNLPLIAVVEDDLAVLNSLEFALRAEGYAVCIATCAADAKASLDFPRADCLVLDYALPDETGLTLLRALRRDGLRCPAVVIASNPTLECRRQAAAAGAPLIEKPLMGGELIAQIAEFIQAVDR